MERTADQAVSSALVLFDGDCSLCNCSARFIAERDPEGLLLFAPLQSDLGRTLLALHGRTRCAIDTLVLIEDERAYVRSTAALRIARRLRWPWAILYALIVVPRPLRDALYGWVARHRYRWFGKSSACHMPTAALSARLLDGRLPVGDRPERTEARERP